MTKKKKVPNNGHDDAIKRAGLNTLCWVAIKDLGNALLIKHRITGEIKVIDK